MKGRLLDSAVDPITFQVKIPRQGPPCSKTVLMSGNGHLTWLANLKRLSRDDTTRFFDWSCFFISPPITTYTCGQLYLSSLMCVAALSLPPPRHSPDLRLAFFQVLSLLVIPS